MLWIWVASLLTLLRSSLTVVGPTNSCQPWQFVCGNGQCVAPNRFCDGNEDCEDTTDEPIACSNCNRALSGETGVKYPLRITEPPPLQRHLNFSCTLHLVATEGQTVEVTFLSFQIGTLQVPTIRDQENTPLCRNGHLRLSESGAGGSQEDRFRSQQTRGFSQLISALKEADSKRRLSTLFDDRTTFANRPVPPDRFGRFCGLLTPTTAGVTFYSGRSNVTVDVYLPPRTSVGSGRPFSLYLTYRFLPPTSTSRRESLLTLDKNSPPYLGKPVQKMYCDRTFVDCDRKRCLVRSPNFPGFFLRNFTCNYLIRQDRVPEGKLARIQLSQPNEYKVRVGTASFMTTAAGGDAGMVGRTTVGSGLTPDCDGNDLVQIFDTNRNMSDGDTRSLLATFCGSGVLSPVVSSGSEMLVVLTSRAEGPLCPSRMELEVRVLYFDISEIEKELRTDEDGHCALTIDASLSSKGIFGSPSHTLPKDTICEVRFIGAHSQQRVWIHFLSYFIHFQNVGQDHIPFSQTMDMCEVASLELYFDEISATSINDSYLQPSFHFCEKTTPVMCARAMDYTDNVPERPCLPPFESYLSSGPTAMVRYQYFGSSEVASSSAASFFVARYEFVDMESASNFQELSPCEIRFRNNNSGSSRGRFRPPSNVFRYGRGGQSQLKCTYVFEVRPPETVQLKISQFRTGTGQTCKTIYDVLIRQWVCEFRSPSSSSHRRAAFINVVESVANLSPAVLVGCVCSNRSVIDSFFSNISTYEFESTPTLMGTPPRLSTSTLKVIFTIEGMAAFEDYRHFGFEGSFEYSKSESILCNGRTMRSSKHNAGNISLSVQSKATHRCRWTFLPPTESPLQVRTKGKRCFSGRSSSLSNISRIIIFGNSPDLTSEFLVAHDIVCLRNFSNNVEWHEILSSQWPLTPLVSIGKNATLKQKIKAQYSTKEAIVMDFVSSSTSEAIVEWRSKNRSHGKTDAKDEDNKASSKWRSREFEGVDGEGVLDNKLKTLPLEEKSVNCAFRCPELNACINPELWCDGIVHCPSTAFDEDAENCSGRPVAFYAAVATGVALLLGAIVASVTFIISRKSSVFPTGRGPCVSEHSLRRSRQNINETVTKNTPKPGPLKYYPRQIQAVEVRYPIIHM